MSKQQLSQMINNLINDKPEQASTALHDYLAAKMQEVAGIKENYGSHGDDNVPDDEINQLSKELEKVNARYQDLDTTFSEFVEFLTSNRLNSGDMQKAVGQAFDAMSQLQDSFEVLEMEADLLAKQDDEQDEF
jgi:methyl-accepting chemotaxis protein